MRMGVHTGEPIVVDDGYVGLDVNRAARICDAANGGQVLVSQATRDLAGRELRDLGSHRLKDLGAAERLYQLGAATFPVLRTLRQTTLPVQPTPLFGREAELAELVSLLHRNPLLTLTGPGGAGKTRLALELAATVTDDYRDGVWWVPLAAVADPAMVLPEIGEVVDARGDVSEFLATRQLLLLLDNFEQVVAAAPHVAELLARAPDVRVIATSRERLALSGEQEYPVPPLADAAAAELFVTRARQVQPRFEPDKSVIEICHRLDGLPLALELAATRVKLMAPRQIAERLDRRLDLLTGGPRDLPARQATMRAAIDWSYDLLSDTSNGLFARFSVFIENFELEAAQAVCDADLDVVQSLVEKSLIRLIDTERFLMLETIREYALQRLEEAGAKDKLVAGTRSGLWPWRNRHGRACTRPSRAPGWPACRPIATTWARFWTGRWITIHRLPSNSRRHSSTRGLCAGSSTRSCHASNGRSLIPTRSNPQCGRRPSAPTGTRSHSAARTMRWRNGYSMRALHYTADSGWRVKGRSCCLGSASSPGLGGTSIGRRPCARRRWRPSVGLATTKGSRGPCISLAKSAAPGSSNAGAAMLEEAVAIDRERGDTVDCF